jgi:hypothetical protein
MTRGLILVGLLLFVAKPCASADASNERPEYEHSWEGEYIRTEGNFAYFNVDSTEPLGLYLGPLVEKYRFKKGAKYQLYCDFILQEDPETQTAWQSERLLYAEPL